SDAERYQNRRRNETSDTQVKHLSLTKKSLSQG
ncbi:MAG: hypothetical protein ACI9W2_004127, partial [Gammaproteobacteria bacterium]